MRTKSFPLQLELCKNRTRPDAACRRRCRLCNRPTEAWTYDRLCQSCSASWNVRKGVRHV